MIVHLNHYGQLWWGWMWPMLWQTSLLIAFIYLLDRLLRRWAWPHVLYALWLLVFAKLLLPPTLESPVSIVGTLARNAPAPVVEVTYGPFETSVPLPAPPAYGFPVIQVSEPETSLHWQAGAMMAWAVGLLVLLAWVALRLRSVRRTYLAAHGEAPLPDWLHAALAEVAARLRLRRVPRLVLSPSAESPAAFGLFRPVLIMPAAKVEELSPENARYVLLHELSHVRRGDLIVHAIMAALLIVYWVHPLLWVAQRRMRGLRELSCDATVADILREDTPAYQLTPSALSLYTIVSYPSRLVRA